MPPRKPTRAMKNRAVRKLARRGRMPTQLRTALSTRRTTFSSSVLTSTVAAQPGAVLFSLDQVPSYTEFTSLFDQYKINAVRITFMPRATSQELGTNNNTKFFSVIDYDDSTAPATLNDLLQYPNVKTTALTKDHSRYLKPKFAKVSYQTAVTSGYSPASGWIDCASSSVPHYAVKYWLSGVPVGSVVIDLKVDYYMSFRGVR